MEASEGAPVTNPAPDETLGKLEETVPEESVMDVEPKGTLAVDGVPEASGEGGTSNGGEGSSLPAEEREEKTLAVAEELMERGSKALDGGDVAEAVDCFSRALEIKVGHYGELAEECASAYYKYGCALLSKFQEEADPLGVTLKNTAECSKADNTITSENNRGISSVPVADVKHDPASITNNMKDTKEGGVEEDQEDGDEGSESDGDGDGEDLAGADEDESDLDLAWKMLDIARAIAEKHEGDTMEKVNILDALAETSMEREDFETSVSDYKKALSILERIVEPDSRRICELNFRLCMVLEAGSMMEDAIQYCQRALSVCNSRLQRLKEEVEKSTVTDASNSMDNGGRPSDGDSDSSVSMKDKEMETLSALSTDIGNKLEDLQQLMTNPKTRLAELMQMISSKLPSVEKSSSSSSGSKATTSDTVNSQNGPTAGDTTGFDSPKVSAAGTNGGVTNLGVVGRGIKRATVVPISAEPCPKKPLLDSSAEKPESAACSVVDSDARDPETNV
ncbi:hypothetical protein QJS10_CPB13g00143 [Acorus calamus]|uniref:Tetratricopeptide SHNi-TPR domain-containing protein n=1 Tax=Acorus calamus TaxID=4465 RepID=A0AAV9DFK7_ACOCL|nr:hypothetical protein QJS10_CPB13g00143 [Acorus calamus]